MKKILNEWRKFVKESETLVLDYPELTLEFLRIPIDENLLKEEADPQAPSLEDLQSKPPEFFKAQMNSMLDMEKKTEDFEARIQKDEELNNVWKNLRRNRDKLQVKSKAADPITSVTDLAKNFINSIFGTGLKTTKVKLADTKSEMNSINAKVRDALISTYNPYQREIFRAISVFTGANYQQIRDPDSFDPAKAEMMRFVNDGVRDIFTPSKDTYVKAKLILRKLAKTKLSTPKKAYRGFLIDEKDGKYPGLESYSVNREISIPNLTSFSAKESSARRFMAKDNTFNPDDPRWQILMYIPNMTTGVYVQEFSQFEEENEDEIIYFGDFKVLKLEFVAYYSNMVPEGWARLEFNNLQDLKNKEGYRDTLSNYGYILATLETTDQ